MRAKLVLSAFLALATAAAFADVRNAGFLTFDDDQYVTDNPHVAAGLTWDGARWALTTLHVSNWHPVTWLSHMLDVELFGPSPPGHHLMNVGLHAASAVALLWLLARMTGALAPSALVAALFALHPMHVESVAWISERKDVLSTLLGTLSVFAYVGYAEGRSRPAYAASLALFALALGAKSMLVTLPFLLLLLDVWPLGRARPGSPDFARRAGSLAVEKLPFFALSAAASALAVVAQRASGALWGLDQLPLGLRAESALVGYARYLGKAVWPVDLAVFYPHPLGWPAWQVAGAALLLAGLTFGALRELRSRPYLAVGWLWFTGALVPVIGLVQVGNQSLADRYTYLPYTGLFIAFAWGLRDLAARGRAARVAATAAAALAVAGCAAVTARTVPLWRDTAVLFEHAIETTRDNAVAHNTVGYLRARRGETRAALTHFDAALRIHPDYALAHYNKGATLLAGGDAVAALPHLRRAVELHPGHAHARLELARALLARGLAERAATELRTVLDSQPEHIGAREQLALALERAGDTAGAALQYGEILRRSPGARRALRRLAWIHAADADPTRRDAERALRLAQRANTQTGYADPEDLDLLAAAYAESGRFAEAAETAEGAAARARAAGALGLARDIDARAALYRSDRAYRRAAPEATLPESGP